MNLISKVKRSINRDKLFSSKEKLVLAISGGIDSVVLLDIISRLHKNYVIAHFDHKMRNHSQRDRKFVEVLAKRYRKKFVYADFNKRENGSNNLEEKLRDARYSFLIDVARDNNCNKVLIAHHGDDQLETVMLNMKRGSSRKGLAGMGFVSEKENVKIVRPLLDVLKADIAKYAEENTLSFVEDKTNKDKRFARNRLRIDTFSGLKREKRLDLLKSTFELQKDNRDLDSSLNKLSKKVVIKKYTKARIFSSKIFTFEKDTIAELLLDAIKDIQGDKRGVYKNSLENVINAIKNKSTAREYILPNKLKVIIDYDSVIVLKGNLNKLTFAKKRLNAGKNNLKSLNVSVSLTRGDNGFIFDADKLRKPLYVRACKEGDRFQPLSGARSKKVKNYFIDSKIPRRLRGAIPLIVDKNDDILGILGMRQSNIAQVNKNTKNILAISYKKE